MGSSHVYQVLFARLAVFGGIVILVWTIRILAGFGESPGQVLKQKLFIKQHKLFEHSMSLESMPTDYESDKICPTCNCSESGSYLSSPTFHTPLVSVQDIHRGSYSPSQLNRFLQKAVLLIGQTDQVPIPAERRAALLSSFVTCPDRLLSSSFQDLKMQVPTSYIFTRTSMYGRLGDIPTRLRYFARHADTISHFLRLVKSEGYRDGARYTDRQLIWLIAEDGDAIDPDTSQFLRDTGLPFIYFAHGPTRSYGLAQWNVLLSTIEFVRDHFFGDGPVLCLDDDARIDPELLRRIWQVNRAVLWQVGNLWDAEYESTWEGPVLENGTVVRWHVSWNPKRIFPIDMLGFAINSSMIGPGRPLQGPWHVPDKRISAPLDTAPESEFLEKIYSSRESIEYLCENTAAEQCFYAWHNDWF